MARPVKESCDFFFTSSKLLYDTRVKVLRRSFKDFDGINHANNAFFVFDYLFREIFGNEGYYIKYTEDLVGDTADFCYLSESFVRAVIEKCADIGLFHKGQFEQNGILTSRAIQRKYEKITEKRKDAVIESRFCVLYEELMSEETELMSSLTELMSPESTHRKEKKPIPIGKESENKDFPPPIFDSDSEESVQDPFTLFREYWNLKAKTEKRVKMSPIRELIASPAIANNLFSRIEEHGGDVEVILIAIDRIADAEFWYGKKLGATTFLKDTMFPKFLNSEWGNFKTEK